MALPCTERQLGPVAGVVTVGMASFQLPWLEVTGDWFEDDPAVALHDDESEPVPDCVLLELVAVVVAAAAVPACWTAIPPPSPRKVTALNTAAANRDREAAWRRRPGRRVPPRRRRVAPPRPHS